MAISCYQTSTIVFETYKQAVVGPSSYIHGRSSTNLGGKRKIYTYRWKQGASVVGEITPIVEKERERES